MAKSMKSLRGSDGTEIKDTVLETDPDLKGTVASHQGTGENASLGSRFPMRKKMLSSRLWMSFPTKKQNPRSQYLQCFKCQHTNISFDIFFLCLWAFITDVNGVFNGRRTFIQHNDPTDSEDHVIKSVFTGALQPRATVKRNCWLLGV